MKRILVSLSVLAVLGGGGAYAIWWYVDSSARPAFRFETVTVDRGRITASVTATGTLSALVTVQVGSQVSGRISKIYVDFNSPVRKGQLVARIDPALFVAAVEQGRANVLSAKANLATAEAKRYDAQKQYERAKTLVARDLIARADFDTLDANLKSTTAQVEASKAAIAQAQAQLHQAQINHDYTRIASPTDGTVISRNVDVGQTVAASFQS